ncbi:MAG: hypothetical protein LBL66_00605 [Clostridiales bacterium]|jgi:hypothetical protein|nr:hypothetical protein [Clostridiales bacterium]
MNKKIRKTNKIRIEGLGEGEMPIGAYCSPQPAAVAGGVRYPSMIRPKVYRLLADFGVNLVYGHAETLSGPNERNVFRALELCGGAGMRYLPRSILAERYVSLGHREIPDWRTLSGAEKAALDERFAADLRKVKRHRAFAGISFFDEPGTDSFPGIAAAKAVFERECPDKLFYVNLLPNNIDARQLQYGANIAGAPACSVPELFPDPPSGSGGQEFPNARRYEYYLNRYIETVKPQVLSYDSYPFLSLGGIESMHHIAAYELQQLMDRAGRRHGIPYWPFIQVGGKWDGGLCRPADFAEISLCANLSLAYGAKGLQLFPACFPNDWLLDKAVWAGAIARSGETTEFYWSLKYALGQAKACQRLLTDAEFMGAVLAGKFEGMLPPEEKLQKIEWNETIYRGRLPDYNNPEIGSFRELARVEATSQAFTGCFDLGGKSLFYAVNNSIVAAADVRLKFRRRVKFGLIHRGVETAGEGDEARVRRLAAGDGFLAYIKE